MNLKLLPFSAIIFLSVSGCTTFHQERPVDWAQKLDAVENARLRSSVTNTLIPSQVSISSKVGNEITTGLGVALTPSRIATVAHVVSRLKVNDPVTVNYAPALGAPIKTYAGRVTFLSPETEMAIVELVDDKLPAAALPKLCENSISGNTLVAFKPYIYKKQISSGLLFSGLTTDITQLPKLSAEYNELASGEGYPPAKMIGQTRVTALTTRSTQGGNSGGALLDIDQGCVVALVSMKVPLTQFESPKEIERQLKTPVPERSQDNRELLFAVPVTQFKKFQ